MTLKRSVLGMLQRCPGATKFLRRCYWHRMGYKPRNIEPGSFPYPRRQVPVCGQKSFNERIKDIMPDGRPDSTIEPVNIGFQFDPPKRIAKVAKKIDLEPLARRWQLKLSVTDIHNPEEDNELPTRRFLAANHYGIFNDLFGSHHYFMPVVDIPVYFSLVDSTDVLPVYCGNHISPRNSMCEPLVDFSRFPKDSFWTLTMTSPDEPLSNELNTQQAEYVHWMVANITPEVCQDNMPKEGDLIVDYLPPLPYFGTGFHRYVFLLYRQHHGPIDLNKEMRGHVKESYHEERLFRTEDFYRRYQDSLTPAGVAFFQASWDESVTSYLRKNFPKINEPIFEIQFPNELPPPQSRFPLTNTWFHPRRHPWGLPLANSRLGVHEDVSFDVYLDRYRDRREMDQELVHQRLSNEGNPLDPDHPRSQSPYPLASPPLPSDREVPSWWKQQEIQKRLRKGRWAQLEGHED